MTATNWGKNGGDWTQPEQLAGNDDQEQDGKVLGQGPIDASSEQGSQLCGEAKGKNVRTNLKRMGIYLKRWELKKRETGGRET